MRNRRKRKSGAGIIAFMVLCICATVIVKRIELNKREVKARNQIEQLEKEIELQEERSVDIDNLAAYVQTKGFIEEVAREKLGLVYEEEIIIKPVDK